MDASRGQWGTQLEFLLACIGYAVGLGNVWRFPYLCYKNGGGAFLIPYAISLFVAGLPMFYLELLIGQFSSLGPNSIFGQIAPITRGIDCYSTADSQYCKDKLKDTKAESDESNVKVGRSYLRWYNKTCVSGLNASALGLFNCSSDAIRNRTFPSAEFFERYMLNISGSLEDIGSPQWHLVLANFVAWLIIFLCLFKGIKSTGKVVYFTVTFPYLVNTTNPLHNKNKDKFGVSDSCHSFDKRGQVFYSLGPAWGGHITMASYNRFHNNCFRDAVIVALTNCGTSFFAGFAIFSVLGFLTTERGCLSVANVVDQKEGLAFVVYPAAIVQMPIAPQLWAVLFFLMLFGLGLDSQFIQLETLTTAILDQFPKLRQYKSRVVFTACFVMFILGLPLCTPGGMYVFRLMDDYSAGWSLILLSLAEVLTVAHLYGKERLVLDLGMMLGEPKTRLGKYFGSQGDWWLTCWQFGTPFFLLAILVCAFVFYETSKVEFCVGVTYWFPSWAEVLGWTLSCCSILMIPAFAIVAIVHNYRKGRHWKTLFRPKDDWGPADPRNRKKWRAKVTERQHGLHPHITEPVFASFVLSSHS